MSAPPDSSTPRRIGLRAVAEAAGVSLMTASLALRNSPLLAVATGRHVRETAAQLGYRPDPEISRLMGRLRLSRQTRGSTVLAMIDLHRQPGAETHSYDAAIRQGIAARADALGFGVSIFRIRDYRGGLQQMLRVIRHRGIAGAVLLPSDEPIAFDPALRWDGISVVAATTTVTSPSFHRVVPNQFLSMMTLIEGARQRGYCRLGAVFSEVFERRTQRTYSIALAWHGHRERILVLPAALTEAEVNARIGPFLKKHSPDLIFGGVRQTEKLLQLAAGVELIALDSRPKAGVPYLDQRPASIGESAVSLLTGMMHNNETGIPAVPRVTAICGVLREPARKKRRIAQAGRPPASGR